MSITSNLYPPFCPDTCPAFIRTASCKIYFSLSMYNSAADIKNVQISLINQRTNASALKTSTYPSGIKIANLYYDPDVRGDYNYYVQINPSDLAEGSFGLNQFYKVQLRFTSISASDPPSSGTALAKWLYDNMQYFSEWSKVCLIKGIEQPLITIRGFNEKEETNEEIVLTNSTIDLIGEMYYANNGNSQVEEKQYLKSYNVKIYQNNNFNTILFDSGQIYTNPYAPNEINYKLGYNDLYDGVNYNLILTYTTNNSYTDSRNYNFTIIQTGIDRLNANITATPDNQNGRIKINIVSKNDQRFIGNLTIRRTSSKTNFHQWEDVKTIAYTENTSLDYTWYDIVIESGVWYKYCAQRRDARGDRGVIIQTDVPVMCVLEDIFLTKKDCQLKIKFNPSLNEFKYNVTESQQVTLGSQYPYVKRNGNNYFRSFPIGGLISSFIDTTNWYDPHFEEKEHEPNNKFGQGDFKEDKNEIKTFTSKDEIYGESKLLYDQYNYNHNINEYNDYIYEREFRKKVYDFLYKHDVKLFRSTTEGNILIKLMNIDFQPVESLGRRLYSFTATAIEIDEPNLQNYQKYGIQEVGECQNIISSERKILGQIQGTYNKNSDDIINIINSKYTNAHNKGFINEIDYLTWLRLEITSDPYAIIQSNGELVKLDDSSEKDLFKTTLGYIVQINGVEMIISPKIIRRSETINEGTDEENSIITTDYIGYFELKEDNTQITSLKFKYPTTVTIDYITNLRETEDTRLIASKFYYSKKIGQLFGTFQPNESIFKKIYNKYVLNYKSYYQRLLDILEVQLEGQPNTVVYVKDSRDSEPTRHILQNGYLQLKEQDVYIQGIYFYGKHFNECLDPLQFSRVNGLVDFTPQEGLYDDLDDIQNPINGGIYQLKSYGIKKALTLENHRILLVPEDLTEKVVITPDNLYTILIDTINDDDNLKFVYYYGCWYVLNKALQKNKLLKGDIRHVRDDQFIPINEEYDSFSEIKNPIPNGVYQISSYVVNTPVQFNTENGQLTVNNEDAILKADQNYALLLQKIFTNSFNRYIYYHNKWYNITPDNDILYPVDGIVNYCCEIVKGVY